MFVSLRDPIAVPDDQSSCWPRSENAGRRPRRRVPLRSALTGAAADPHAFGLLALLIGFYRLTQNGLGDLYYTAADLTGSRSIHALFYSTFDRGGVMAVDKPPLGLVGPAAAIHLFGVSSWTVLGPQVVLFALGVGLICAALQRWFDRRTGLIAASIVMLTPMSVAIARSNNPDELLVLLTIVSLIAVVDSLRDPRLRHVLIAGLAVGLAFNTKELQAVVTVPAILAGLLFFSPLPLRQRAARTAAFAAVAGGVSIAWITAVDSVAPSARPYVPNSTDNTEARLAFGFNGTHRIAKLAHSGNARVRSGWIGTLRRLAPQRTLFGRVYSAQTSWLLLAALIGALVVLAQRRVSRITFFLMLWTGIHVAVLAYMPGKFSAYYLAPLIPGIAALVAFAADAILPTSFQPRDGSTRPVNWTDTGTLSILLAAVAIPAVIGARFVGTFAWSSALVLATASIATAVAFQRVGEIRRMASTPRPRARLDTLLRRATVLTATSCLIVPPTSFLYADITRTQESVAPKASLTGVPKPTWRQSAITANDAALIAFVRRHQGAASNVLATSRVTVSAILTVAGYRAVPLGGFFGTDPYPALPELQRTVAAHQLRWIAVPDTPPGRGSAGLARAVAAAPWGPWVRATCRKTPSKAFGAPDLAEFWKGYESETQPRTPLALYDCATTTRPRRRSST